MKWITCLNENGVELGHFLHLQVAVKTAPPCLEPICLYDGKHPAIISWLQANGVRVIQHKLLFENLIRDKYHNDWSIGSFMRTDIPVICSMFKDKYVLYTDCDVMFMGDLANIGKIKPNYFAASTEFDRNHWVYFNSGTILYNVEGMLETYDAFVDFIARNEDIGTSVDQHVYNMFYVGKWDRLPVEYNWKPYWGVKDDIEILHFHGPKPEIPWSLKTILNQQLFCDGYEYYNDLYYKFKKKHGL